MVLIQHGLMLCKSFESSRFFCLAAFIQRHLQRLSWKAIFQLTEFEPSIPQQGVMFGLEEDEEGG